MLKIEYPQDQVRIIWKLSNEARRHFIKYCILLWIQCTSLYSKSGTKFKLDSISFLTCVVPV